MKKTRNPYDLLKEEWDTQKIQALDDLYRQELKEMNHKIIVLDDDPTGIQTVHDVYVYTNWSEKALEKAFCDGHRMSYILTNSRSFDSQKSFDVHYTITKRLLRLSSIHQRPFLLILRGDSTLRGHYSIDEEGVKKAYQESQPECRFQTIFCPAFFEGQRYTIDKRHYLMENGNLIPAAQTEFARDSSFSYHESDLDAYIEEKTNGRITRNDCFSIPLDILRHCPINDLQHLTDQFNAQKTWIVDASNYNDLKAISIALFHNLSEGSHFLIHSAASLPKILGGIDDKPYLGKKDLVTKDAKHGGLIIVGSHVQKTSRQLQVLRESMYPLRFFEFDISGYPNDPTLSQEVTRLLSQATDCISQGITPVIFTSRQVLTHINSSTRSPLDPHISTAIENKSALQISVDISMALTRIVKELLIRPRFILAKGGITSSDIGTYGLNVKRAKVLGQILPGIPVWLTDDKSHFPDMPYIIFPGNVGQDDTLSKIVKILYL